MRPEPWRRMIARRAPHRVHDTGQVDAEHLVPVGALQRVERLAAGNAKAGNGCEAGVGEHDVDPALRLDDVVEERLTEPRR